MSKEDNIAYNLKMLIHTSILHTEAGVMIDHKWPPSQADLIAQVEWRDSERKAYFQL